MKPGKSACAGLVAIVIVMPKSVWKARVTPGTQMRVVMSGPVPSSTRAIVDDPDAGTPSLVSTRGRGRRRITKRHTAASRSHRSVERRAASGIASE